MDHDERAARLDELLRPGENFDIVRRELAMRSGGRAALWCVDGLIDSSVLERILEFVQSCDGTGSVAESIPYSETENVVDAGQAAIKVLSGGAALAVDGESGYTLVFARHYPERAIEEPDNEKTLRGPRDGFCERLVPNTALIRRRIKDPGLKVRIFSLGSVTKTDVVMLYLDGKASGRLVSSLEKKLGTYAAPTLSFGEQTLAEYLVPSRWYNPFPKVRYTERPDSAAAMILEGSVILICDNSPCAMILPTSIFDFLQESNDFYLPPVTATYLRLTRLLMSLLTVFFVPVWYLLVHTPDTLPEWLEFITLSDEGSFPLFWQIILVELIIDGLKIASLNTPNSLGTSVSVVMGLILGDLAVKIGWFIPEVILYMAFITIANFAQPSYEFGYALKFTRILLLALTAVFNIWGFVCGTAAVVLLIVSNRTVDGSRSYLYPLIPWNKRGMKRFFTRARLKDQTG